MNSALAHGRAMVMALAEAPSAEAVALETARRTHPAILETLQATPHSGRFSYFACDPAERFEAFAAAGGDCPIEQFSQRAGRLRMTRPPETPIPFLGGWMGYMNYEAGVARQPVAARPAEMDRRPILQFGLYDHLLALDHADGQWYAVVLEWPPQWAGQRPSVEQRLNALRRRLRHASRLEPEAPPVPVSEHIGSWWSRAKYLQAVRRVKRYIEAGDAYQVNVAQQFRLRTSVTPFELYRRARRTNPAAFAAYFTDGMRALISASPELFLELRGHTVVTRPIKGTRPRGTDPVLDQHNQIELAGSEKDGAELAMIVDVLRNDLGRVCEYGSVRVVSAGAVEEHPTVLHRVATIEGRLRGELGWPALLSAACPGGSITGAPKIRAMQIIRELEPDSRGAYCGSAGWIGLDGDLSLNIAIRTMMYRDGIVDVYAGGGIVAQSDPELEYEELLAKAAGLFRALNLDQARGADAQRSPREVIRT